LKLVFPDGEVWAVDVKDWENPFLLAKRVGPFVEEPRWDRAYFVFPDHRAVLKPRYSQAFGSTWRRQSDGVRYSMERNFLKIVKGRLTDREAT
jgi:hypothetical protein